MYSYSVTYKSLLYCSDLKKSITFREHPKIFKGAVTFYYLYQFGEAEANFDKGEHGKWLHGASEISAIFSRCRGALTPNPQVHTHTHTHTYNSQYHSHHHRNHHIREGLISVLSKTDQKLILKIKSLFHATVQDNLQSKTCLQLNTCTDDLRFYVVFNSISVISQRCEIDNENLCAMELRLWMSGDRTRSARSVGQRLTL